MELDGQVWSAIERFPGTCSGSTTTRSGTARITSTTTRASIAILHGRDSDGRCRRSLRNRAAKSNDRADSNPGRSDRAQDREAEKIADQEHSDQCPDSGGVRGQSKKYRPTFGTCGAAKQDCGSQPPEERRKEGRDHPAPPWQRAGKLHQENHRRERGSQDSNEGGESPCVGTGGDPVGQSRAREQRERQDQYERQHVYEGLRVLVLSREWRWQRGWMVDQQHRAHEGGKPRQSDGHGQCQRGRKCRAPVVPGWGRSGSARPLSRCRMSAVGLAIGEAASGSSDPPACSQESPTRVPEGGRRGGGQDRDSTGTAGAS